MMFMEATQATGAVAQAQAEKMPEPAQKPKRPPRRRAPKKLARVEVVKSKRKSAVARASVKAGTGMIRLNGSDISTIEQEIYRNAMLEPVNLSSITRELADRLDITVNVQGGGTSAQTQAVRSAIAKAIAKFSDTDTIKKEYMRYDRSLLVDDYRRVEPKKFKGPKARARFQKSYR